MASSIRGSGSRRWGSSEVAAEIASLSPTASTALPLRWLRALRTLLARKPVAGVSALILLAFGLAALLAPLLAPYPPNLNSVGPTLEGPALGYPAGTDQFGRDMLSRLMFGGRVSLSIAAVGSTLSILGALLIGVTSGYFGGALDYMLQRLVDTVQAIPGLVLLLTVIALMGSSWLNVVLAISGLFAFSQSRVVRGAVLSLKSETYIEAAITIGCSPFRVVVRHMLPNLFPVLMVVASLLVGVIILAEASLSFLGFGIPPPNPTWGGMLSVEGRTYMIIAPWMLIGPVIALSVVVFAANMLGDGIRDLMDPRLRE